MNIACSVLSASRLLVVATSDWLSLIDAANSANYTLTDHDANPIVIASATVVGTRGAYLNLATPLPLDIVHSLTFNPVLQLVGPVPLDTYYLPILRHLQTTTVTIPVENFSTTAPVPPLFGSPVPSVFFSPALESATPDPSEISVDSVSVCVSLQDTYAFPVPIDPGLFFLWSPSTPSVGLLGNSMTTLAGGNSFRYAEVAYLFSITEEDTYIFTSDSPATYTFVEALDPAYIALTNNLYWTLEGTGTEPVPFICADNLAPIPVGVTTGPFPLLSIVPG